MVFRFHFFQGYFSLLFHPETIEFDGMQRPSWSSVFIVSKTILVSFAIQRQSSLMACGDHHGHLPPISKTSMSFDRDCYSLLCLPETIKFVGTQRQIMVIYPLSKTSMSFNRDYYSLLLPSRDHQVDWHIETNYGHLPLFEDDNVFSHYMLSKGDNDLHLYFKDNVFSHCMLSKGDNAFLYILKTIMSSVIACLQKATMPSFTFRRRKCLQSLHAFKRRQCPPLYFEDNNVFSHCMLSEGDNDTHLHFKDDNIFNHSCF